jgi:hypothetical protein
VDITKAYRDRCPSPDNARIECCRSGGLADMTKWWVKLSEVLLRGLEIAISVEQTPVAGYVARLRGARPDATPVEIVAVLEKRYMAAVTGTGAAVGGVAAAPSVGAVGALALSGGETAVFLQATALFALAVAEVHGIRIEEVERRRTLVLAVVVGDHGARLVEKMTAQAAEHWAQLLPEVISMSSIAAVNNVLSPWFVTKYVRARAGIVAMSRVAPFGAGVVVGAGGNRTLGRTVVNTSRRVFGPPPACFSGCDFVSAVTTAHRVAAGRNQDDTAAPSG